MLPAQQGWPLAPHARHVAGIDAVAAPHASPTLHVLPAQQGAPLVPHAAHMPLVHTLVAAEQRPAQHG